MLVYETVFQLLTFDTTKPVFRKIECMSVKCFSELCLFMYVMGGKKCKTLYIHIQSMYIPPPPSF
jgi:hypothetical protein